LTRSATRSVTALPCPSVASSVAATGAATRGGGCVIRVGEQTSGGAVLSLLAVVLVRRLRWCRSSGGKVRRHLRPPSSSFNRHSFGFVPIAAENDAHRRAISDDRRAVRVKHRSSHGLSLLFRRP
jgi:hypothetical protein